MFIDDLPWLQEASEELTCHISEDQVNSDINIYCLSRQELDVNNTALLDGHFWTTEGYTHCRGRKQRKNDLHARINQM